MNSPVLAEPDLAAPGRRPVIASRGQLVTVAWWVFAAIPFGLALLAAVRASRMHVLLDYWHVFAKITDDGGNLQLGQVFTDHLDQPFVVPSLLFWADAAWFGGDNRVLTVLTVALLAVTVFALRTMLPQAHRMALTAAISLLLFTSHAAELWQQGTNGISWVPAVTFSAIAIACAHRGRLAAAVASAVLGCLSFGAALPIWFVIAFILWLRKESRLRVAIPAVAGVIVVAAWWLTKPAGTQSGATSAFDPDGRLSVIAAAAGGLWSSDIAVIAVIAGGLTLALSALLVNRTIRDRLTADAGWAGLALYAFALAVMLSLGRTTGQAPGGNVGLISRYVLVAALATSALIVLATLHRPQWPQRYLVAGVVLVSLTTHAIGGMKADGVRRSYAPLALSAIALRVDAPAVLASLQIQRGAAPAARAVHAYPFNDSFTLGCHGPELGGTVDLGAAQPLPRGGIDSPAIGDAVISGWTTIQPDCVVVTDATGTVVGGGVTGLPRLPGQTTTAPPDATMWQAVAKPTAEPLTVLAVQGGRLYRLANSGS